MNVYRAIANDLRRQGASARRVSGGDGAGPPLSVGLVALALACAAGIGIVITIATFVSVYPSAVGHLRSGRVAALDRFAAAGLDLGAVDASEFRNFIATRPEDRANLIEIGRYWGVPAQHRLVELSQQSKDPGATFFMMTQFAYLLRGSPAKQKLAFAVADLDEVDAARLTAAVDPAVFFKMVMGLPLEVAMRALQEAARPKRNAVVKPDSTASENSASDSPTSRSELSKNTKKSSLKNCRQVVGSRSGCPPADSRPRHVARTKIHLSKPLNKSPYTTRGFAP